MSSRTFFGGLTLTAALGACPGAATRLQQQGEDTLEADTTPPDQGNTEDWPKDAAGFAEKAKTKDFLDMGSVWTVEKSDAFDGGWVVLGSSNDGEETQLTFAARIDKLNLLCRGYVQNDGPEAKRGEVRDDALAACKAITLP